MIGCAERQARMPFSAYRDNFDAETLAILEAAFNEAWEVVTASGGPLLESNNAASPGMVRLTRRGPPEPETPYIWHLAVGRGSVAGLAVRFMAHLL